MKSKVWDANSKNFFGKKAEKRPLASERLRPLDNNSPCCESASLAVSSLLAKPPRAITIAHWRQHLSKNFHASRELSAHFGFNQQWIKINKILPYKI